MGCFFSVVLLLAMITFTGSAKADPQENAHAGYQQASDITIKYLQENAEKGDAESQNLLAWAYHNGNVALERDDSNSFKWFEKSALQGNSESETNLGGMYERGLGTPKNYGEAMNWYRKAADQGNAAAHFSIGFLYFTGEGGFQDIAQAISWFGKAAELGSLRAQLLLGQIYDYGLKVPQDKAEAKKWYRKAAEQGNAEAQSHLGLLLLGVKGVPQDYTESLKWFRKASEQGDRVATGEVGRFYDNGWGVPLDKAEAQAWYHKMFAHIGKGNKSLVNQIFEGDIAREVRGSIGIRMQNLTVEMAQSLGLQDVKGALLVAVSPGGSAAVVGIKLGDVIVRFDGCDIDGVEALPIILALTPVGKNVKVEAIRAGKPVEFQLSIGELSQGSAPDNSFGNAKLTP